MTLKHVLKIFSKTEIQEDKTHPYPPLKREGALDALNNAEHYPLPLEQVSRECKAEPYPFIANAVIGEELLCERSELSNSGEGCKDLPSPVAFATQSFKCRKTRHFDKMLKQVQHDNFSCAEHTVKDLSSNRLSVLTTLKKVAFTLAEVLITLGIIGVVAALTLPAVIKNKENMELQSSLKLAYSTLNQALLLYQNDNGIPLKPEDIGTLQLKPILLKYIKNAKDCGWGTDAENACVPNKNYVSDKENYKPIYKIFVGNDEIIFTFFDDGQFIMNNSMLVMLENSVQFQYIHISVDINGINKKPNRLGQDLFMFQISDDGRLLPMGANGTRWSEYYCQTNLNNVMNGAGCTNKALREKDFFKKLPK